MRRPARLGFVINGPAVRNDILVPRYYDPSIPERLRTLKSTHELVSVGELLESREIAMTQGNYIGKMTYGTGTIPYIRTSDISNWELRGSPKHGVSVEIYDRFAATQDVRAGDILLVHEGTYLIGTLSLLTRFDTGILYQHHLAKIRVLNDHRITPALLAALLLTPIVQRQIRTKQLTADTIDSIVGRFPEVVLPIPTNTQFRKKIAQKAQEAFYGRAVARARLAATISTLDTVLQTGRTDRLRDLMNDEPTADDTFVSLLGERSSFSAFSIHSGRLLNDVMIPRYYDPTIDQVFTKLKDNCELRTLGALVYDGLIVMDTGHEIGKLAYGTGTIPFVRTSDLGNWELKHDPKHRMSRGIYDEYAEKQPVIPEDILLVRDGTYLVGTSAMVHKEDLPLLYCGGIYRIPSIDKGALDPYLLFALLNTQIVRRQIQNKRFTRDVIDTLGSRLQEVVIPIPRNGVLAKECAATFRQILRTRIEVRSSIEQLGGILEGCDDRVQISNSAAVKEHN